MAETKSMRVVPSGKIYRQMFEAQVQLNRSLTKIPKDPSTLRTSRGGTLIPLVHMSKDDLEHGLLGERQRTWVDGFPNDPYVENPVVYKQYAEYVGSQMKEPESSVEGREVRGLPDVVAPARVGSDIIERIAASRKDRHEASIEEMHQELSVINADMEPQIGQSCEGLLRRLDEDDQDIASLLARFDSNEDLLTFPLAGLHDLWTEIQGHSEVRQGWITELDERLKKAEDDRMEMIKSVFQDYAKTLEKIAHVMAPDVHRFMDKESQVINQTVLSNRRAYGDLYVRLMSADIEREKSQHAHWKRRVDDWKMLKTELAIERFKKFMQDEKVVSPPGVHKVMQYMVKEQELLNAKRLELINQLRDLTPPSSTKTSVYHWNKGVQDISQEIDSNNQLQLSNLHKEYENVCQDCLDEIEAIKKELIEAGVCSESRSKAVVEEFMIPLVGDRQRIYEQNLETMEKALEEHNKLTTEQLKSLFKYAQASAHVWDVHEIGLARQERALQEKLEQCRQQHDNQNQDKEAHLDIIMDRMRQDATEKALKDSLTKALDMLEKIRHAYEIFHKDQTNIVKQYPEMVKGELNNYDDALCRLFMVDRTNPADKVEEDTEPTGDGAPGADADEDDVPSSMKDIKVTFRLPGKGMVDANKAFKGFMSMKDKISKNKKEDVKKASSAKKPPAETKKSSPGRKSDTALLKEKGLMKRSNDLKAKLEAAVINDAGKSENKVLDQIDKQKQIKPVVDAKANTDIKNVKDKVEAHLEKEKITKPVVGVKTNANVKNVEDEVETNVEKEQNTKPVVVAKGSPSIKNEAEMHGVQDKPNFKTAVSKAEAEDGMIKEEKTLDNQRLVEEIKLPLEDKDSLRIKSGSTNHGKRSSNVSQTSTGHDSVAPDSFRSRASTLAEGTLSRSSRPDTNKSDESSPDRFRSRTNTWESKSCSRPGTLDKPKSRQSTASQKKLKGVTPDRIGSGSSTCSIESGEGAGKGKKKQSQASKPAPKKEAKDLASAVNEVLTTNKGTMFYVLTVAGEHGIPPDKPADAEKDKPTMTAFMTEVSNLSGEDGIKPEYLRSIDVHDSLLNEIKKQIRINFLNHLEEWTEQASERAQSVVVAKCEELNSELDLRLHLHKPRARRAEYDVHNVRAAELVMHSERVTRHCKGIQQALTEVRNRLTSMTTEHNTLAAKFRQDIEGLEVVFINATKASKLYGLKNQLNLELDKFMSVIRASLRQFRQHLDETLQMLRESNARFIKSFKVFSDGGNFCPEEIDEYRKRLDKMANNIDKSEGSIMSDLEDMESKRLEQATKVAMEFEDRFKNHMFDLIFMEKIARWLTNTQVKIKGEVANSNTQAQKLGQHLQDIDRRIDACERPNLDKEQITSEELNDSLKGVFEAFQSRSTYLNCLKDPAMRPPSGVQTQGARVGFVHDSGPTPISKAGKQPHEDPSLNVIKGIMKSNKSKLRFGLDAELDGDYIPSPEGREKMKSSMSTNASSERGKASRHGGPSPGLVSTNEGTVRKATSAATNVSISVNESRASDLPEDENEGTRRSSKPAKYEKKTVIFGDVAPDEEDNLTHFLGIIRKCLKEALEGLLAAAEMYYKQKGSRPVTRPQALQETFEQCADVIIQKLQSYFQQADEYHNRCLQEFRSQLQTLEKSVAHIPQLVVIDLLKGQITLAQNARGGYEAQFTNTQDDLEKKQEEHKHLLRPTLGHPHQKPQLEALCKQETDRHTEYISVVEEHAKNLQTNAETHAKQFVEALARMSESQLLQYDNMLVIDDVEKGRVEAKKYPTTELIRRKNAGEPLEDDDDKDALPRGKNTWNGIPNNEMVAGEIPGKPQLTASVTTAKTTLGHSATMTARDQALEEYKAQFRKTLQEIEDEKQRLLVAEQRWMDSWNTSVDKVRMLYQ